MESPRAQNRNTSKKYFFNMHDNKPKLIFKLAKVEPEKNQWPLYLL